MSRLRSWQPSADHRDNPTYSRTDVNPYLGVWYNEDDPLSPLQEARPHDDEADGPAETRKV